MYDQRYFLETSLEEIETSGPSPLNNNDPSGITLTRKDKARPNTTRPTPRDG